MKKLIIIAVCLFTGIIYATVEVKEFNTKNLEFINIANLSGDIKIIPTKNKKGFLRIDKIEFNEEYCRLIVDQSSNALSIESIKVQKDSWFNWFSINDCRVNLTIKAPKMVELNIVTGSGNLEVDGTKGDIIAKSGSGNISINAEMAKIKSSTGSGDIKLQGLIGSANVKTGSGDIKLQGLIGSANVKTGSGDITLSYKTKPKQGSLKVITGSGDVLVSLPETTKISTNLKTGSGNISNDFKRSVDATLKVTAITGSGDITIEKQ